MAQDSSSGDAGAGGTDLGRRIAERRDQAHLTVTDVAERAGMSPQYLHYLESSPVANPTPATLDAMALALHVGPSSLAGAGLNLPPGQRSAARNAMLHELTMSQCRELIALAASGDSYSSRKAGAQWPSRLTSRWTRTT